MFRKICNINVVATEGEEGEERQKTEGRRRQKRKERDCKGEGREMLRRG